MHTLKDYELERIAGGMPNPASMLSYQEALKRAKKLGTERKSMGTWTRMNEVDFMKWWRGSNINSKEYLDNKKEVDDFIAAQAQENQDK